MALNADHLAAIESAIEINFPNHSGTLKMLELGDQIITAPGLSERTGKEYFENRGIAHTSVDLNGLRGSLKLDLTKPGQFLDLHNRFDIITNSGTTEHVDPLPKQYECFSIIHECLKPGGIMIHIVPDIDELNTHGAWKYHCNNYYSENFFKVLAKECEYDLLDTSVSHHLRCATLKKTNKSVFMLNRKRFIDLISHEPIPWFIKLKWKIGILLRSILK